MQGKRCRNRRSGRSSWIGVENGLIDYLRNQCFDVVDALDFRWLGEGVPEIGTPRQRLTQSGSNRLKRTLYIAADVARKIDPELAAVYVRCMVHKGHHHKQALCVLSPSNRSTAYTASSRPLSLTFCEISPGKQAMSPPQSPSSNSTSPSPSTAVSTLTAKSCHWLADDAMRRQRGKHGRLRAIESLEPVSWCPGPT